MPQLDRTKAEKLLQYALEAEQAYHRSQEALEASTGEYRDALEALGEEARLYEGYIIPNGGGGAVPDDRLPETLDALIAEYGEDEDEDEDDYDQARPVTGSEAWRLARNEAEADHDYDERED
jgi:hypothetical protein